MQALNGEGELVIGGKPLTVNTGDTVLLPANVPHAINARQMKFGSFVSVEVWCSESTVGVGGCESPPLANSAHGRPFSLRDPWSFWSPSISKRNAVNGWMKPARAIGALIDK